MYDIHSSWQEFECLQSSFCCGGSQPITPSHFQCALLVLKLDQHSRRVDAKVREAARGAAAAKHLLELLHGQLLLDGHANRRVLQLPFLFVAQVRGHERAEGAWHTQPLIAEPRRAVLAAWAPLHLGVDAFLRQRRDLGSDLRAQGAQSCSISTDRAAHSYSVSYR